MHNRYTQSVAHASARSRASSVHGKQMLWAWGLCEGWLQNNALRCSKALPPTHVRVHVRRQTDHLQRQATLSTVDSSECQAQCPTPRSVPALGHAAPHLLSQRLGHLRWVVEGDWRGRRMSRETNCRAMVKCCSGLNWQSAKQAARRFGLPDTSPQASPPACNQGNRLSSSQHTEPWNHANSA
jgi:hypothetical protein